MCFNRPQILDSQVRDQDGKYWQARDRTPSAGRGKVDLALPGMEIETTSGVRWVESADLKVNLAGGTRGS